MAVPDDEERLLERLRAGDAQALTALVERHHATLVRVALAFVRNPATAEEVAQETWARVLGSLDEFAGRSSLKTWIFRICTNHAVTRAARDGRSQPFSSLAGEDGPDGAAPERFDGRGMWSDPPHEWEDHSAEQILARGEAMRALQQELERMPPAQRAVLTLRDLEGLDAADACNVLGVSESNQRVLLHRARTRIRQALERAVLERPQGQRKLTSAGPRAAAHRAPAGARRRSPATSGTSPAGRGSPPPSPR